MRTERISKTSDRGSLGFTLVELLVVIAIIGILTSMILPAVQSARESGRRTECANKLRQLAIACLAFEGKNKVLPYSNSYDDTIDSVKAPSSQWSGAGWIIRVLPHMEEQALYDQFVPGLKGQMGPSGGIQRPECRAAMQTQLAGLLCPSDTIVEQFSAEMYQWKGTPIALTNYKGVMGANRMGGTSSIHPGSMPDCHRTSDCSGIFWRNSYLNQTHLSEVHDGQSKTFLVGEDLPEHNFHSAAYYANGDYSSCQAAPNYLPDPPNPDFWPNAFTFRSRHTGGVQFSYVDTSTKYIDELIDLTTYQALSTKAGGEIVNAP